MRDGRGQVRYQPTTEFQTENLANDVDPIPGRNNS